MSVDAVMVANAALAEVGLPAGVWRADGGIWWDAPLGTFGYRASLLGEIAEHGADHVTQCYVCSEAVRQPCIPARDALLGRTCGRS